MTSRAARLVLFSILLNIVFGVADLKLFFEHGLSHGTLGWIFGVQIGFVVFQVEHEVRNLVRAAGHKTE